MAEMASMRCKRVAVTLASIGLGVPAEGVESDADALALADSAPAVTSARRDWRATLEAGAGIDSAASGGGHTVGHARLSASLAYDGLIMPNWRAAFSNRLDTDGQSHTIHSLKQAFLSWQPNATTSIDAGRVNLREGVALGFNPTDYFKTDAARSITAIDPESLRENRQGSVVLRGQTLWADGAFSTLLSPKITKARSRATFNPDFGATNHQSRYLLTLTQRLFGNLSPQWLLYDGDGMAPQLGVNLSTLIHDATTGYLEYSGGRGRSLVDGTSGANAFHSKLAAGLTHTFSNNVSWTIEYHYDGASADRDGWSRLALDPPAYWQYRLNTSRAQELMTRHGLFSFARWQDALVKRLDLSAMGRVDLVDYSRSTWLEARYHWPRVDTALQWVTNHGRPCSTYGVLTKYQVNAVITVFF